MQRLVRVAAFAALLGLVHSAAAQTDTVSAAAVKKAAAEFSLGKQAYQDGDYLAAAEHFEAADDTAPNADALRAAMTSRKKGGELDRAATLAELALERHPDAEKLAAEARELLAIANEELHRLVVTCDAACSLVVGTSLVHGPPARERVVYLFPGAYEVQASWRGDKGTRSQTVEAEVGGVSAMEFEQPGVGFGVAEPEETEATEPDDDFEEYIENDFAEDDTDDDAWADKPKRDKGDGLPPAVFAVGVVATAGLGGVTIWSGVDTINSPGANKVAAECTSTDCDYYKEGQAKETRTNILVGATSVVGIATIVIGAVATDWGGKEKGAARRSARQGRRRVEPWVTVGQGAAIGARGRF
jgi:hypothetical protein